MYEQSKSEETILIESLMTFGKPASKPTLRKCHVDTQEPFDHSNPTNQVKFTLLERLQTLKGVTSRL